MGERLNTVLANDLIVEIKQYCREQDIPVWQFMKEAVVLRLGKFETNTDRTTLNLLPKGDT